MKETLEGKELLLGTLTSSIPDFYIKGPLKHNI